MKQKSAKRKPPRGRKKRSTLSKFIGIVLSLALIGGGIYLVISLFTDDVIDDKVTQLKKMQYPQKYSEYVDKYSELYDVDENLVYAVIRTESHFNPDDKSGAGAMGLMQITSECFDFLKQNIPDDSQDYPDSALYEPETNIKFGTYFLSYLLDRYDDIEKTALAAYNAGFGCVDEWLSDKNCSADGENLDVIIYPETADYVVKVEDAKKMYNELY